MFIPNITENIFQIARNQTSEIFILSDLRNLQRPQMQIICHESLYTRMM